MEPIKWSELTPIQKNALIAEKVMGWEWIDYDYRDVSQKGQRWLLPDLEGIAYLAPGEWLYYQDEPEVYPKGSVFPERHKDNRYVPAWIPNYIDDMNAAWLIFKAMSDAHQQGRIDFEQLAQFANMIGQRWERYVDLLVDWPTAEDICIDALRACGVEIV